jgi:cation:H+ antiporter
MGDFSPVARHALPAEAPVELVEAVNVTTAPRSLRRAVAAFVVASGIVLLFAPLLALSAQELARVTGVGETFLGVVLLAASTSLPELVASLTAIRLGAFQLAVGNLFGSNAYNVTALVAADLAFLPGPILAAVDPAQAIAGLGAIMMMGIALAALLGESAGPRPRARPIAVLVLLVWVIMLAVLYRTHGAGVEVSSATEAGPRPVAAWHVGAAMGGGAAMGAEVSRAGEPGTPAGRAS